MVKLVYRRQDLAFSLIELLVVIAIIGILIAIGVVSWASAAARNRDSIRKTDLQRYRQVLEQYFNDYRKYPVFDVNGSPSIYSANWQLESNLTTCLHTSFVDRSPRLTASSKYFDKLPKDPNDNTNYKDSSCPDLRLTQTKRYLYISGTSDSASGPDLSPTVFGLMTTLERPDSNAMNANSPENPFTQLGTVFGSWYKNQNVYPLLSPNYLVTNRS